MTREYMRFQAPCPDEFSLEQMVSLWGRADAGRKRAALAALMGMSGEDRPGRALRISEAAKMAGVSRGTLYNAMSRGALQSVRLFEGASPRILESELHRFLNGAERGAA
jgi:excisionase family DNA binding protein